MGQPASNPTLIVAARTGILDYLIRLRTFGALVLCYHAVRPDQQPEGAMPFEGLHVRRTTFEAHCEVLKRLCTPMSLSAWTTAVSDGASLPARPVLVTFDDGYRSVMTEALPVLQKFNMPATIFLCSDPVARSEMFWYDAVATARGESAVAALKNTPYEEWRRAIDQARTPVPPEHPAAPLRPADVRELGAHDLIEIGGHSHRHPILAQCDEAAQREEIADNLDAIEQWTSTRPRAFAYPNGRRGIDFTAVTERLAAESGIDHAFSTDEGYASATGATLSHPRFVVTAGLSSDHLLHRLAMVWR